MSVCLLVCLSVCLSHAPILKNGAGDSFGYYEHNWTLIGIRAGNRTHWSAGWPYRLRVIGRDRNSSKAVAGAISAAFARWLHHRYALSNWHRRGHIVSPRDTLLLLFWPFWRKETERQPCQFLHLDVFNYVYCFYLITSLTAFYPNNSPRRSKHGKNNGVMCCRQFPYLATNSLLRRAGDTG